jgi:cytochrome b6-f complex iron-sulfur subunit
VNNVPFGWFKISKSADMDRKEFLKVMTGGLTTTCVACMMAACSKDGTTPSNPSTPTPNPTPGNTALLTVNLANQMLSVNDFVAGGGVIVIRIAAGNAATSFVAFSSVCPHAGSTVVFQPQTQSFNCPAHNSNFNISGAVTGGPAGSGLTKKTVEISGTTLTVK